MEMDTISSCQSGPGGGGDFLSSGTNLLASIALAAAHIEEQQQHEADTQLHDGQQEYQVSSMKEDSVLDQKGSEDEESPSHGKTIIVTDSDVLCGRGGETNHHPGNVAYRALVKSHQPLYLQAKRRDKPKIARTIVDTIMVTRGGRFLKRADDNASEWVEISVKKAREKTSQALRENAPTLRSKDGVTSNSGSNKDEENLQVQGVNSISNLATLDQDQGEGTSPKRGTADNRHVSVTSKTEVASSVHPSNSSPTDETCTGRTPSTNHCLPYSFVRANGDLQDMSHFSVLYAQNYANFYRTPTDVSCPERCESSPPLNVKTNESDSTSQHQRQSHSQQAKLDVSPAEAGPMRFAQNQWDVTHGHLQDRTLGSHLSPAHQISPTKLQKSLGRTTGTIATQHPVATGEASSSVSLSSNDGCLLEARGSEDDEETEVASSLLGTPNKGTVPKPVPVSPSFSSVSSGTSLSSLSPCRGPRLKRLKRRRTIEEQQEQSRDKKIHMDQTLSADVLPPPLLPFRVKSMSSYPHDQLSYPVLEQHAERH